MKIVITYASAGVGHKNAAEALRDALSDFSEVESVCLDILDWTNPLFKSLYPKVYLFLINRMPFIWGVLYYFFDLSLVDKFLAPVRRFFHLFYAKRFIDFIRREKPDVVACTHFFPSEVISELKKKGIFRGKLITIITDFLPHTFWLSSSSDYFITAVERTKADLIRRGIREEHIKVLGIPCGTRFGIVKGRISLIRKLGLKEGFFNLLIMGGGFGTGPLEAIISSIGSLESEIKDVVQMTVICGMNKGLFERLNNRRFNLKVRLNIFGYMDNIDEFMETSDCIITKSGGLTVSEALSERLPMIIIQPIPGQEAKNCRVLTDFGTAVVAGSVREVKDLVRDFVRYPERISNMKRKIDSLGWQDTTKRVAEFVAFI